MKYPGSFLLSLTSGPSFSMVPILLNFSLISGPIWKGTLAGPFQEYTEATMLQPDSSLTMKHSLLLDIVKYYPVSAAIFKMACYTV